MALAPLLTMGGRSCTDLRGKGRVMGSKRAVLFHQIADQFAIFLHIALEIEQPARFQLHRQQIDKLYQKTREGGMTIVPLTCGINRGTS